MIVRVYDTAGNAPLEFDVYSEDISFIDNESHGPAKTFGITPSFAALEGRRKLILSSPNVVAVEVVA